MSGRRTLLRQLWVVFRKELRDALRDRRAMRSMLIFPLLGPLVAALVLSQAVDHAVTSGDIVLPVSGAEHAPALMAELGRHHIRVVEAPAEPIEAVRAQRVKMVLLIGEDFEARYRASQIARLTLLYDASRTATLASLQKVEQVLQAHSQQVGALRLLAHGIQPSVQRPLRIARVDVSTPRARGALFLSTVAMFVLLAAFVGGMYTATDVTAGERERGSLEPLLVTPALRLSLVLGKWLVTVVLAAGTVIVTLATLAMALRFVPAHHLGLSVELSARDAAQVLAVMLPLCLLSTALQVLVATFARTFKEAQTYLSLLLFLPMIPGVALSLRPLSPQLWTALVPVLGQQTLLNNSMRGEPIEPSHAIIAGLMCVVLSAIVMHIVAWLLRREKVIFGR